MKYKKRLTNFVILFGLKALYICGILDISQMYIFENSFKINCIINIF